MPRQLNALLQVVEQVAQTSLIDFCSVNGELSLRLQGLTRGEQASLDWLVEQVRLAAQIIVVPDVRQLPKVVALLNQGTELGRSEGLCFYAGFPVRSPQREIGVLSVMARSEHILSLEQQHAIATLAHQISYFFTDPFAEAPFPPLSPSEAPSQEPSAVPLLTSLTRLNQGHAAVMKLSMALQDCLSLEDLNNQLIAVLPHELPIAAFELMLNQGNHAPQRVCLWPAHTKTPNERNLLNCQSPLDSPPCMLAKQSGIERLNLTQSPLANSEQAPSCATNWYCYPLKIKHRTIGVLKFCLHPSAVPQLAHVNTIYTSIAEQISITIHRLQLFQKLQSENLQDPLTKLFNRRYMMSVLSKLLTRVSYGHYQVGLIMMDIDHFKHLNDTFGHDAGDQVLRVIGLFLKGHARPNDAICRYGGEEFALILSDVTWEVLERRANQLCRSVRYLSLNVANASVSITLSAGYAIAPVHAKTPSTLIKAADEALYAAKRAGRDRAIGAPNPEPVTDANHQPPQ